METGCSPRTLSSHHFPGRFTQNARFDPRELLTQLKQTGRTVEDIQLRILELINLERAASKSAFGVP